jgi:hypothetical protein
MAFSSPNSTRHNKSFSASRLNSNPRKKSFKSHGPDLSTHPVLEINIGGAEEY